MQPYHRTDQEMQLLNAFLKCFGAFFDNTLMYDMVILKHNVVKELFYNYLTFLYFASVFDKPKSTQQRHLALVRLTASLKLVV